MKMNSEQTPMATSKAAPTAGLADLRQGIDAVDRELLALLNRRAALSLQVGRLKAENSGPVFRPQREHEILERLARENPGPLPTTHIQSIWREIFSSSRTLQRPLGVAYLGPEGTHSYFAAAGFFGQQMTYQPCKDFREVFSAVAEGQCALGVVPLENALHGTVGQCFDLFMEYKVFIQSEFLSRIQHCLLSIETTLDSVRTIYSHPQALAQCQRWLWQHAPHAALVSMASTAAAARRCLVEPHTAAIGHSSLSALLSLPIVAYNLEDEADNQTRFVVIGAAPVETATANLTSVLFSLSNNPGSLAQILDLLARAGVNLRKLESRPLRAERWKYAFFADLEATRPALAPVFEELRPFC
ncbi:MAG: chorismate mutase, partial [Bilophila sp.]